MTWETKTSDQPKVCNRCFAPGAWRWIGSQRCVGFSERKRPPRCLALSELDWTQYMFITCISSFDLQDNMFEWTPMTCEGSM